MARRQGPVNFDRRKFMKTAAAAGVTCAATEMFPDEYIQAQNSPSGTSAGGIKLLQSACPYCGVGCTLVLHTRDDRVVKITGEPGLGVSKGWLCVKGRFGLDFVASPNRLTTPLIRRDNELQEATWDEALDFVATRLTEVRDEHGPDAIAGFSSAKCTNEENYLFQKFLRAAVGTNHIDHCAHL